MPKNNAAPEWSTHFKAFVRKNGVLVFARCFSTGENAIKWLESNDGGVYKNTLHNFSFKVDPSS